jgi:hypothetical protein
MYVVLKQQRTFKDLEISYGLGSFPEFVQHAAVF